MTKGLNRAQNDGEPMALKLNQDEYDALWNHAAQNGIPIEEAARALVLQKLRERKKEGLIRPLLRLVQ